MIIEFLMGYFGAKFLDSPEAKKVIKNVKAQAREFLNEDSDEDSGKDKEEKE